jgi:hypothetical protein
MDPSLKRAIQQRTPPINTHLANGLAVDELREVRAYVNTLFQSVESGFPDGLVYESMEILTPLDEYLETISVYGGRCQFDLARSDMTMVMLIFSFHGERITKPLYLPFVRDGGMICIKGASFSVSPVLADKGVSYGTDGAFIQIPKARIMIKRTRHTFFSNHRRRTPNVAYSWLHRRDRRQSQQQGRPMVDCLTTIVHYLFAKYGIRETFRRFLRTGIVVGDDNSITEDVYPPDQWTICTSAGRRPKRYSGRHYTPSTLRLAIRNVDCDDVAEAMIAGTFYIVDHFPQRVLPHYLDGEAGEIRLWRILLGLIIGGVTGGESCVKDAVDEHMDSLDYYIDGSTKTVLEEGDIYVNDIYELLYHVLENLSQMVLQSSESIATLYEKQLSVLKHALRDINEGINVSVFSLKNMALKKEQGLSYSDVKKIIMKRLPIKAAMKMNNPGKHPEIASVCTPNDNKFFKITSNVVLQSDSGKKGKANKQLKEDKTKFLHVSIAEVCSYIALTNSEPTGRAKLNPWVILSSNGTILRNPELKPITESTQRYIRRY